MASPGKYDFLGDLQAAEHAAAEQEKQSSDLLREKIAARAKIEPEFRRALARDPAGTVAAEARRIGVEAEPELVEETRQKYSTAIVGATEEQVNELVFGTLRDVQRSFYLTMVLARWLFGVGLTMTVAAFVTGLWFSGKETISALFGAGGLLTLISYVVMNPMDRIRNAAANLVQIQIAYVAYYKQLSLLGGSLQERVGLDEAIRYAKELREGAETMIQALQGIVKQPASAAAGSVAEGGPPASAAAPDRDK